MARVEAVEAPVSGSRSEAARAPLLRAEGRAPADPERGAPHLRPHHGKRRAGPARPVFSGRAGTAGAAPGAPLSARAWRGLRDNRSELPRPPGLGPRHRRVRPPLRPTRAGGCPAGLPPSRSAGSLQAPGPQGWACWPLLVLLSAPGVSKLSISPRLNRKGEAEAPRGVATSDARL